MGGLGKGHSPFLTPPVSTLLWESMQFTFTVENMKIFLHCYDAKFKWLANQPFFP